MKLHPTVVEKLIKIYETYGGHREEVRLREKIKELEVEVYTQKQRNPPDTFVVLKEDVDAASGS